MLYEVITWVLVNLKIVAPWFAKLDAEGQQKAQSYNFV